MSSRWIVNDCLGTIGGIRTLWHDLRDSCGCEDRTGGYTPFNSLADWIEKRAALYPPAVVVRNASYFRPLDLPPDCRTISIAQDILTGAAAEMQREVISRSDVVVFNSEYTRDQIGWPQGNVWAEVIPIGTDFELFSPPPISSSNMVLFVGSGHEVKGWRMLRDIIERSGRDGDGLSFCIVTKDGAYIDHPQATCRGPLPQEQLAGVMRTCAALLCTSLTETQHLAGIEAAACGLPLIVPPVGIYQQLRGQQSQWGEIVDDRTPEAFIAAIRHVLVKRSTFRPREFMLEQKLDRQSCIDRWNKLLAGVARWSHGPQSKQGQQ